MIIMTYSVTYLPKIHVKTKNLQGSFQQHLSWQLATGIEDHVALNGGLHILIGHAQLVVARLCAVVTVCGDFSVLQGIHNPLSKPGEIMKQNIKYQLNSGSLVVT